MQARQQKASIDHFTRIGMSDGMISRVRQTQLDGHATQAPRGGATFGGREYWTRT
jgi:hypothetical protein